ncbi:MAG TPA: hypothetical protein VM030_07380 [Acidimicrobiales bacterium]|nr:hypothetical protein [Acidimicrobiales bacterium]
MAWKTVAGTFVLALLVVLPTSTRAVTFTRLANSPTGRTVLDPGPLTMTAGSEAWHETGRDFLPFDYEQGVASDGRGNLFFNSRGMIYRTTTGCPSPGDDAVPCYDVRAENRTPIDSGQGSRGFNHVGDTSAGRKGPAAGFLFTPVEKSPGNGVDKIFKVFDAETLATAGTLDIPGPFSHHAWVVVDPSGRFMLNADATIRKLEVYRISRNPKPASPAERVFLTRAKELDVSIDEGIPGDVGPTGCSFRDDLTLYCADWRKNQAKWDEGTDVYRIRLRSPVGISGNSGSASKAFSFAVSHRTPSITYGLEGEGVTFYRRTAGGPNELHVLIRGEHLASTFLLHLAPGRG